MSACDGGKGFHCRSLTTADFLSVNWHVTQFLVAGTALSGVAGMVVGVPSLQLFLYKLLTKPINSSCSILKLDIPVSCLSQRYDELQSY